MATPSIKGAAFQSAWDDVQRLFNAGQVSRRELEVRFSADASRVLEEKVNPATWYPIDVYRVFVQLLVEKEARGNAEEYLVQRGWRAAERIRGSGVYSQLEASPERWGVRVGKLIVTISGAMYNFTRWSVVLPDQTRPLQILVEDALEFAEECRYTALGFVKFASAMVAQRSDAEVTSTRPTPDRVIYEIPHWRPRESPRSEGAVGSG